MLQPDPGITERMVLFWHNHFVTEAATLGNAVMGYQNNALLRLHALGNFKTMTRAVTIDPGMLRYLNGYLNTASAPDENYGRELQELFTVGKDATGQPYYTEDDVKNAAKVLTGYRITFSMEQLISTRIATIPATRSFPPITVMRSSPVAVVPPVRMNSTICST